MSKKNIVMEDVAYGIYDRPGPTGQIADSEKDEASTVPDEVPLQPSQHIANQLSVQRPPIEDEDYVPSSTEELSRAASAIAQLAPGESIEFFYRQLHKLLDDATDKAAQQKSDDMYSEEEKKDIVVKESSVRRKIRKFLLEALSPDDLRDYEEFRGSGYSITEPDLEDEDEESLKTKSSGEMSLEDLAKEFGYSGPTGISQYIKKLTDRLTYMASHVKKEDLQGLVDYAVGEFIDTLEESGVLDPDDVEDLRSAPGLVKDLDSFRYFFVSALVNPAWNKLTKSATKSVKQSVEALGLPPEIQQTVFNQATGGAARGAKGDTTLRNKLDKLVKSGKITAQESSDLFSKVRQSMPDLVNLSSKLGDNFVEIALEKWSSTSRAQRIKILRQAMESTLQD